jgi:anti-sigma B factor antagonist
MANAFTTRTYAVDRAVIVQVAGEVDLLTAGALERQLHRVCRQASPATAVVLDLSAVSFLAAAGLGVLVCAQQDCDRQGRVLRVVATQRAVLRPITLTGLDRVLETAASIEDALGGEAGDPDE